MENTHIVKTGIIALVIASIAAVSISIMYFGQQPVQTNQPEIASEKYSQYISESSNVEINHRNQYTYHEQEEKARNQPNTPSMPNTPGAPARENMMDTMSPMNQINQQRMQQQAQFACTAAPGPMMGGGMMGGMGMGMWGMMGMNPMQGTAVNDENILQYIETYIKQNYPSSSLEVKSIEKYSNNYYVLIWDTERDIGALEIIVFPNGMIHPEPQSMMWNYLYGHCIQPQTQAGEIDIEKAKEIAEKWISTNIPGSRIVEEYVFPGYYTFHFKTPEGQMQMLSVNAYTGYVVFHQWHGNYIGSVYSMEQDTH